MTSRASLSHPPATDSALWTAQEVAAFLRLNEQTVRRMAARGDLPCVRVGGGLRFVPSDITRWVSARKEGV
jgi:excisionase family DNA binding protein